jgi:prepilin-type N-terminal cleavage/methylation domain-containing protein
MSRFRRTRVTGAAEGFSLIEVIVAMGVLSVALLSLAGVFAMGVQRMRASSPMLIAREKAREAVESVHAARDTAEFAWNQIRNVADGGVFLDGAQPLRKPGMDGLVNTADDISAGAETIVNPGNDGVLSTVDDQVIPLTDFTREIRITPLNYDGQSVVNPNLREVTVTVRYLVDGTWRTYRLVTFVSSYS